MKRKMILTALVLVCMMVLTGCFCQHEVWNEANCTTPKTCAECGETEGAPLGHSWIAATCETPKTCEVCAVTEGEAKGHSWVEATCETAKVCSDCHLTEGEALGHSWIEATTEAPKTCEICALTEGERIITDPRFTTAATKDIQGLWAADLIMTGEDIGLDPGIMDQLTMRLLIDLRNDGTMFASVEIPDEETFMKNLIDAYVEMMYAEFESYGMDRTAADDAMKQTYGMGLREYLESTLGTISFNDLLSSVYSELNLGGVYYIENGKFFSGSNWKAPMVEESYILDGDTLVIDSLSQELGQDVTLTRVTE